MAHVAGGTLDARAGAEHFTFAGGFQITVELLFDGHADERVVFGFESGIEGSELYVERSGSVSRRERFLL